MNWLGLWRNQYGSTIRITRQDDGTVEGLFRSASPSSPYHDEEARLVGVCHGKLISVTCGRPHSVVAYTGMFADGKLQTLWHLVADQRLSAAAADEPAVVRELEWWEAVSTGADTFERVGDA